MHGLVWVSMRAGVIWDVNDKDAGKQITILLAHSLGVWFSNTPTKQYGTDKERSYSSLPRFALNYLAEAAQEQPFLGMLKSRMK